MRKESNSLFYECLICKEVRTYLSIGSCDHKDVCLFCSMRLRIIYKDTKCSVCNTKLEYVYMCEIEEGAPKPLFAELDAEKDDYFKDEQFESNGIFYTSYQAKEQALKLRNFICPIKKCKHGIFDTFQILSNHLMQEHKRQYCEICISNGKLFLSESNIYTHIYLKEHMEYGEFSTDGSLISPAHPICPFCKISYYNDEHLHKHLNEMHISCHICKNRKNLVYYNQINELTEHFQFFHQVCPYEECIKDTFVVFEKEEELNQHLLTKHKCKDGSSKMAEYIYNRGDSNKKCYKKIAGLEFNFTNYIKELKEKMNNYIANRNYNNQYEEEYNDKNYNNNNKYYNQNFKNNYDDSASLGYYPQSNSQNQEYDYYNQPEEGAYNKKNKKGKKNYNDQDHKNPQSHIKIDDSLYYLTLIDTLYSQTKEYISEKIRKENPENKEFFIPREKLYQMIVIIDKLELKNISELQYITNFGVPLEEYKYLKNLTMSGIIIKNELFIILDRLELKQLLVIYKYFYVSYAKVKGLFYRLEIEQVDDNLYSDFVNIDRKKKFIKLTNLYFADYDPLKDKEVTVSAEMYETKQKPKLNFTQGANSRVQTTKKSTATYGRGKWSNEDNFPELVSTKSVEVEVEEEVIVSAFQGSARIKYNGATHKNTRKGKIIPGATVTNQSIKQYFNTGNNNLNLKQSTDNNSNALKSLLNDETTLTNSKSYESNASNSNKNQSAIIDSFNNFSSLNLGTNSSNKPKGPVVYAEANKIIEKNEDNKEKELYKNKNGLKEVFTNSKDDWIVVNKSIPVTSQVVYNEPPKIVNSLKSYLTTNDKSIVVKLDKKPFKKKSVFDKKGKKDFDDEFPELGK